MAQKIAVIILAVALVLVALGIFVFVVKNQPTKQTTPETAPKLETTPTAEVEVVPKAPPTEEEIKQEIITTTNKINEANRTRPLSPQELMFLDNPRQEAIKKLSQ